MTTTCCRGECVDTDSDDRNCRACGNVCATWTNPGTAIECIGGVCAEAPKTDGIACIGGTESGVCCAASESVTSVIGAICCSSAQCDSGDTCCGGRSFDLDSNFASCGECGAACPSAQNNSCVARECRCGVEEVWPAGFFCLEVRCIEV